MEIKCVSSPFEPSVNELLRELSRVGFFDHGLLVGSWPMVVYTHEFNLLYGLRTNDIDFAVMDAALKPDKIPLPEILNRLGYELLTDYQSGIEKYVLDTFEVEFLMNRRGGAAPPAVTLSGWQVRAQPLPFIDILFLRPVQVLLEDFTIRIPSPEALMVHKLIISQRRTGAQRDEKKEKDLFQCQSLAEIVRIEEVRQIVQDRKMSRSVLKSITTSCSEAGLEMGGLGLA